MKASKEQLEIIKRFENHVCHPFQFLEEVDGDDHEGFLALYGRNYEIILDIANESQSFTRDYYCKHIFPGE